MNFIDLFAGAGGLSEGFIRAGYTPIAHVESDKAACYTLRTRTAFHFLKKQKRLDIYERYLKGEINRSELYSQIPSRLLETVINTEISNKNNPKIFDKIAEIQGKQPIDLIIGGPPCQAYSVIGRAVDKDGKIYDQKNYLYKQYARYLIRFTPNVFVFENVKPFSK